MSIIKQSLALLNLASSVKMDILYMYVNHKYFRHKKNLSCIVLGFVSDNVVYDLPFMSCITIELYSRNVTNRFVG